MPKPGDKSRDARDDTKPPADAGPAADATAGPEPKAEEARGASPAAPVEPPASRPEARAAPSAEDEESAYHRKLVEALRAKMPLKRR